MKKSVIIILAVIAVIVIWAVSMYNGLVAMDEKVNGQWANVETQYQRRADLIPNLVDTVKGYATHEKETLEGVVEARSQATQMKVDAADLTPEKLAQYQKAQGAVTSALGKLLAITENYPDLKAKIRTSLNCKPNWRGRKTVSTWHAKISMMLHRLITPISAVSPRISLPECSDLKRKLTSKRKKVAKKHRR